MPLYLMWEIPKLAQTYVKNKKKDYKYKRNIRNCSVYIDVVFNLRCKKRKFRYFGLDVI